MKKFLLALLVVGIAGLGLFINHQHTNTAHSASPAAKTFNKHQYSVDQPGSLWQIVNKQRPLPAAYVPADLVVPNVSLRLPNTDPEMSVSKQMVPDLEAMFAAAKKAGLNLQLASGYRSYDLQVVVYNQEVRQNGQAKADQESAKPGTSEHQTGLAADLEPTSRNCEIENCFADTPEGEWLVANSYKYGFIQRYQKGKEAITGYQYEPWHVRYVGKDLANEVHKNGQTLEEFFGLK